MTPIGRTSSRVSLAAILFVYVALSIAYNVLQPIGEAPDEPSHVEYIRYVQQHRALPRGHPEVKQQPDPLATDVVFDQVPLYYVALGVALEPIWLPPHATLHRNPFVGWPDHPARFANVLHRADEGWPYRGLALFVHLGRLASTLCGLVALLATDYLVVEITGAVGDALFATAWLAFTPGFLLASSRINNDAPAIALSAVTLLLCARVLIASSARSWRFLAVLSLCLASALLSKLHTLFLVPLVFVAVALATRGSLPRRLLVAAATLAFPLASLGAWWLVYGRTFGSRVGDAMGYGVIRIEDILQPSVFDRLPAALWLLNTSWWGSIGASAATPWPSALYVGLALPVAVLICAGLGAVWVRAKDACAEASVGGRNWSARPPRIMVSRPWLTVMLLCLSTIPLFYATIGRQIFPWVNLDSNARFTLPVAPVLALVVVIGGRSLSLGRWRRRLAVGYLGCLLGLALATALLLLPRISDPRIPARLARDPGEATAAGIASFANGVDLLAVEGVPPTLPSGQVMSIALRWRVTRSPAQSFIVFTHVRSNADRPLVASSHDEIPFEHAFPPRLWHGDEIVDEPQPIRLPRELDPGIYSLRVGMYRLEQGAVTPILTISTDPPAADVVAATWTVLPDASGIEDAHPSAVSFGDVLVLKAYAARRDESGVHASLYWQARREIRRRFVVSVQVLDAQGHLIAQSDGEPVGGRLPTTAWPAGEIVRDDHVAPIDGYPVSSQAVVVVYDRETLQRLPVTRVGHPPADQLVLDE